MRVFRFLCLVVVLNVIRYVVGGVIERPIVTRLFSVMTSLPGVFNTHFTAFDWATSFFYNFVMWLTATWFFALLAPVLKGHFVLRSLKAFGLSLLFFVSVSAIYMNHYLHTKWFYIWNSLDALVVFAIVAVANGVLYPRFFPAASARARA